MGSINIWVERPDRILSTNYHRGAIIPAGTAVEILRRRGDEIRFRVDSGAVYELDVACPRRPSPLVMP